MAATPSMAGTPSRGSGGAYTPGMTPMRDVYGLNDPYASADGESARDQRARQKAARAELQSGECSPWPAPSVSLQES